MTEEKTLGRIACEAAAQNLRLDLKDPWNAGSHHPDDIALHAHWEIVASAVREKVIEDAARKLDVLAEMTTEPQATAYRFAAYRIRPKGNSSENPISSSGDRTAHPSDGGLLEPNLHGDPQ